MRVATKLNYSFMLTTLLPFMLGIGSAIYYYSGKIKQEAQERITSDLKVAELMYQAESRNLCDLTFYFSNDPVLKVLLEYRLWMKLDEYLLKFEKENDCDAISIMTPQQGVFPGDRKIPDSSIWAGCDSGSQCCGSVVGENSLMLMATAPIYSKKGLFLGTVVLCRSLATTGITDRIARETGANALFTLPSQQAQAHPPGFVGKESLLHDIQGNPAGSLVVWRSSAKYDVIRRTAMLLFILIGILGLVLISACRYMITRAIVRPLVNLEYAANRLIHGDYSVRVQLSGYDEIGSLGDHFNRMAAQIESNYASITALNQELAQSNQQLEQTIEARTKALLYQNDQLNIALDHLTTTHQQMVVQEKLASLGELTAGIAHEIKNPLNLITTFAQIMLTFAHDLQGELAQAQPDHEEVAYLLEKLPQHAQKILEHGKRAANIIHSMLEHSHMESGKRRDVHVNSLVKEYVKLTYHGMRVRGNPCNVVVHEQYDPGLDTETISIVPQDIGRVIANIMMNAYYEMNKRRKSSEDHYEPTLTVCTRAVGDIVEIRIRDNGNGIPAEMQSKIFQPFFTTKPAGEGTGLGLSLSYDIITKEHQGQLGVESQEGEYAEFIILLPKRSQPICKGDETNETIYDPEC